MITHALPRLMVHMMLSCAAAPAAAHTLACPSAGLPLSTSRGQQQFTLTESEGRMLEYMDQCTGMHADTGNAAGVRTRNGRGVDLQKGWLHAPAGGWGRRQRSRLAPLGMTGNSGILYAGCCGVAMRPTQWMRAQGLRSLQAKGDAASRNWVGEQAGTQLVLG